jgi:hypothetical protein
VRPSFFEFFVVPSSDMAMGVSESFKRWCLDAMHEGAEARRNHEGTRDPVAAANTSGLMDGGAIPGKMGSDRPGT